jgi:hypothetical protein
VAQSSELDWGLVYGGDRKQNAISIAAIIETCFECYPSTKKFGSGSPASEKAIQIWVEELGDYPLDAIRKAFRMWVRHEKWPPTVCDMHEVIYNVLPTEKKVFRKKSTENDWDYYYKSEGKRK